MVGTTSSRLRSRPAPKANRPSSSRARRPRNRISYNEDSSDSGEFDGTNSEDDYESPKPTARPRRNPAPAGPATNTHSMQKRKRKASAPGRKTTTIGAKRRINTAFRGEEPKQTAQAGIHFSGKTMPWTTMPYHLLASVFAYASHPLVPEQAFIQNNQALAPAVAWLVSMALVCKAFTEPALAALYFEPPIFNPRQIQSLESLLKGQNSNSTINYRGKIRCLQIGTSFSTLKFSSSGVRSLVV